MATIATFAAFSSRAFNSSFNKVLPTGGNYVIDNNGAGKRVHVFTSPGTFSIPPGTQITDKFVNLEILAVGAGGPASSSPWDGGYGGGGGGGATIYDSAFRMPKASSISVNLWDFYGTPISVVDGLPGANPGGQGGATDDYSKGWPGGSGGGGSWQNGAPNGSDYTVSNPGYTYGNTGPAAPTNTKYLMPVVLNNPAQTASNVANTLTKTYSGSFFGNLGNGQYGCTTNAPDSTKGLAGAGSFLSAVAPYAAVTGTLYSPKAFRMRGGGGASYTGALGGQGVLTDFHNNENGSYEWICAGGHGYHITPGPWATSWASFKALSGNYGLRDSGVYNGTYYAGSETRSTNPTQVNWDTDADNINPMAYYNDNAGRYNWGSGGSTDVQQDGQKGILILRYDLSTFPGGAASASANVFGGDISYSANGRFRYHKWYGDSRSDTFGAWPPTSGIILKGTSANSQTRIAFDDYYGYRPRTFSGDGSGDWSFYAIKDGGDSNEWRPRGANTDPFYYYRDVPSFTVQYMMIGGGGASGTKGTADAAYENAIIVGGGGAGGISTGSFSTPSTAIYSKDMPALPDTLANAATAVATDFSSQNTAAFAHKAGYIEVRANSLLNSKLDSSQFVDYITNTYNAGPIPYGFPAGTAYGITREQTQPIRIRGSNKDVARLLRRDKHFPIYDGYLGANGTAENPDQQYLVVNSDYLGDPYADWGSSIWLDSGYDHYYYSSYVQARYGRRGRLFVDQYDEGSAPTDGTLDTGPQTRAIKQASTLGTTTGGPSTFNAVATGTHPGTGTPYYNALKFNNPICTWSKASDDLANDRWTAFYTTNLSTYNVSKYDNDTYPSPTPTNPDAVTRIPLSFTQCGNFTPPGGTLGYYDRRLHFSYANSAGTVINNKFRNIYGNVDRQVKIQYVEECCNPSHPSYLKRRFQYIDVWGNDDYYLTISGDWKVVSVTDAQIATYTLQADELVRTYAQVWRRDLRKIFVRQLFTMDVSIGEGGGGNKTNHARRRSGGTTSIHFQNSDTPNYSVGGGGAGGYNGYYWEGANGDELTNYYTFQYSSNRSPATFIGSGTGTTAMQWYNINGGPVQTGTLTPVGSGGGAGWYGGPTQTYQQYPTPGGVGSVGGSSSNLVAGAAGGAGGGSINTRDFDMGAGINTFLVGGASRSTTFTQGRQTKRSLADTDTGHGGRGYFGGTTNWSYYFDGATTLGGITTYYYLNVNQFPFNANFSAGGGGGAGGDGGDGSGSTGGNGGAGVTYSLTGYATVYGAGGGGFGRLINGSPGSSMPADPAAVVVPAGAPDGPAYKPYGIGGGWTPGKQEGGGADGGATKYYPGSGPWPVAYDVPAGTAHMDYMRYMYCPVPGPQVGNLGTRYNGGPGVVIISYDRAPFYA